MADQDPKPEAPEELPPDCEAFLPALELPLLPEEDLKRFVDDFLSDRIFTDKHLGPNQQDMLGMVFMPLALGALSQYSKDSLQQIGCIWEDMSKAGPRSINGNPIFFSLHMLHRDDWARCKAAILREEERRKSIEV